MTLMLRLVSGSLLAMLLLATVLVVPVAAAPLPFGAFLDGPSEEPPVASPGTGNALVVIDPVAHTMTVDVEWADLVAGTTVAHIHVINGPGDANTADTVGPVATTVPTFPDFPAGVTEGTYQRLFDMTLAGSYNPAFIANSGGTVAQAEAELFDAIIEGRAYLNIHSTFAPGGEIRGFLVPVPEPSSVSVLALSLVAAVATRWRRKR